MIDGKTLFEWWEECWPDLPRWGWDNQPSITQRAFNALAERINLEYTTQRFGLPPGVIYPLGHYKAVKFDPKSYGVVAIGTANDEYSTHHKSCALRHDGITCTCP